MHEAASLHYHGSFVYFLSVVFRALFTSHESLRKHKACQQDAAQAEHSILLYRVVRAPDALVVVVLLTACLSLHQDTMKVKFLPLLPQPLIIVHILRTPCTTHTRFCYFDVFIAKHTTVEVRKCGLCTPPAFSSRTWMKGLPRVFDVFQGSTGNFMVALKNSTEMYVTGRS